MRHASLSDFAKPVLAFDSSLGGCIVAVLHGGQSYSRALETEREQAAKLIPLVQEVMNEAGIAFDALGLIVTSIGPGSFTGLRISLSAARAMGLALGIPVQGVTTLEAMAHSAVPEDKDCLVILETKRSDFYVQAFDAQKQPLGEASCMDSSALEDMVASHGYILCGDGLMRFRDGEGRAFRLLDPVVLARVGLKKFNDNHNKADQPEPIYLRGADVSYSTKVQRVIKDMPL